MNRSLYYLASRSFIGTVKHRVSRLKQPKYLIPMILGVLYFGVVFTPQLMNRPISAEKVARVHEVLGWGLAHLFTLAASLSFLFNNHRTGMNLSEAQAELLLSTPTSRKDLIRFIFISAQPGLLFASTMIAFFFSVVFRMHTFFAVFVIAFLVVNLVRVVSLLIPMIGECFKSQTIFWVLRCLPIVLVGFALYARSNQIMRPDPLAEPMELLGFVIPEAYPTLIFAPVSLLLKGVMGVTTAAYYQAIALLVLINFLFYSMCLTLKLDFNAFVLSYARKREQFMARHLGLNGMSGAGKEHKTSWLNLGPSGPMWRAIIWKNTLWLLRSESARNLGFMLLFVFVMAIGLSVYRDGALAEMGPIFLFPIGMMSIVFLPALLRIDFRAEMLQLEVTKQFPISPRTLFFAVVGFSALIASLVSLFILGCGAFCLAQAEVSNFQLGDIAHFFVLVPSLSFALAVMENILIMWLPAWFMIRPEEAKKGGVEFLGRGIIGLLGRLFGISLLMLVPAAAGGAVYLLGGFLGHWVPIISVTLVSALLIVEVVLLGGNAAMMFEKLDPSSVEYQ